MPKQNQNSERNLTLEQCVIKTKCENDHLFFSRVFFKYRQNIKFRVNWHHVLISDVVQDVIEGRRKNVVINVSPGSSKTEIVVINFIARGLALNPRSRFLHLSYSDDLALLNSQTARDIISSDEFQAFWPVKISDDSKSKKRWNVMVDGKPAGGVYATSLAGQITGFRAGHMIPGFQGAIICFPHEQCVLTEVGFIPIGNIVRERMNVKVYSRNMDSGEIELKNITGWHTNPGSTIIEVNLNNNMSFKCTPKHLIWTETRGWVEAAKLLSSDILFATATHGLPNYLARNTKSFCSRIMGLSTLIKSIPFTLGKIAISKISKMNDLCSFSYMFPNFSFLYLTNSRRADSKSFSNIVKKSRIFTNIQNVLSRKLRPLAGITSFIFSESDRIFNVIFPGSITKVRKTIVTFNSIFMSNFNSLILGSCKNLHDYLMDLELFSFSGMASYKMQISSRIRCQSKNLTSSYPFSKTSFVMYNSVNTSSSSHVGNFINTLKAGKCNPDFIRFVRHDSSTYCLSVDGNHNFFIGEGQQAILVSNCDDPLKPEDAFSKTKLNAANRKLLTTVKSRKANPDTPIILIMQRIAENDPTGFIKQGNLGSDWSHVVIPAIIDDAYLKGLDEKYQKLIQRDGMARFSYWPYKEPIEELLQMESGQGSDQEGSRISRHVFSGQYLQNPVSLGGNIIRGEWFKRYTVLPKLKYRKIYADTAQKTKERNDYSVFICFGLGIDHQLYLLDLIRGKWEAPELKKRAVTFWNKHKGMDIETHGQLRQLMVEDKSSGTGLIQEIKLDSQIPVKPIERVNDKLTRVMDVVSYMEAGMVHVPEDAPFIQDYITEHEAFTADDSHAHDDQIDPTCDAIVDMLANGNKIKVWEKLI